MSKQQTCSSCGAIISENETHCSLCGLPLEGVSDIDTSQSVENILEAVAPIVAPAEDNENQKVCTGCKAINLPEARFCSMCGMALEGKQTEVDRSNFFTKIQPKWQWFTFGGIALVILLFGITAYSKTAFPPTTTTAETPTQNTTQTPIEQPLSPELQEQVKTLETQIEQAQTDSEKISLWQDIIALYGQNGRFDKAGEVQETIAQMENTPEAWATAGHLYYDWMDRQPAKSPAQIAAAKAAIANYQKALELNPDDLNVRTDMASAYLNDPDNPMKAIQETNKVLEQDPNHVQANFNKGIMLWTINRLEDARQQFEKVKTLVDENNPAYQRANEMIQSLESALNN